MRVLVTGASGFIGTRVCHELAAQGATVRALVRHPEKASLDAADRIQLVAGDITDSVATRAAAIGMDAVVHLAARVHVMKDRAADPLTEFRRTNVQGTRLMLDAAREAGVSHFILASSVKAVGEASQGVWSSTTPARPVDPYGVSKLEAESLLLENDTAPMTSTILRFPVVYGPAMRGNMLRLFELVSRGWPVPIGRPANARSLLFVGNAAAAIARVLHVVLDPADAELRTRTGGAPAGPFFLADARPLSTEALIGEIAIALGKRPRTIRLPVWPLASLAGGAPGSVTARVAAILNRLIGSLEVDELEFQRAFGFTPPASTAAAMAETAQWFRSR